MKLTLTLLLCCIFAFSAEAITHKKWQDVVSESSRLSALDNSDVSLSTDQFLNLTPKKYREMTGERLGIAGSLALKAAQKRMKKARSGAPVDLPQVAYILMSLFFLGWLAIGLLDDWQGDTWWIALILYFVFVIPGIIYSLVKMQNYY